MKLKRRFDEILLDVHGRSSRGFDDLNSGRLGGRYSSGDTHAKAYIAIVSEVVGYLLCISVFVIAALHLVFTALFSCGILAMNLSWVSGGVWEGKKEYILIYATVSFALRVFGAGTEGNGGSGFLERVIP